MRVVVLRPAHADEEAAAARRWAMAQGWEVEALDLRGLAASALAGVDACWVHAGSQVPVLDDDATRGLTTFVRDGGHVVLSLLATPLAVQVGGTGDPPSLVEIQRAWRDADDPWWTPDFHAWPDYPHIRGFQGWGVHPLFRGLLGGTFSWTATDGELVSRAVHTRPAWPEARVIAVDRSYVHLDADTAVAWEYEAGAGRITCLGANVAFGAANQALAAQRDAILRNALLPAPGAVRTGWPTAQKRHASVAPMPRPRAIGVAGEEPTVEAITQAPPLESPVTLGAPHGLLVGSMADGVSEVWLHPLCVIDGGIALATELPLTATSATASAVHLARTLRDSSGATWREASFVHASAPEFVYVLSPVDAHPPTPRPPDPPTALLEFRLPLRRQWPFAPDALVPLRVEVRRNGARTAVTVTGRDGDHVATYFIDGAADVTVIEDEARPALRILTTPGEALRLVVRASSSGTRDLTPLTTDAWGGLQERIDALHGVRDRAARLWSGDAALDDAWSWACARLANFMAAAPIGGRGLMAGYAGSRPGWNVSCPGYAWFFGRDACWTVDGLLAVGLVAEARDAIALLAKTLDVTGKVIHELTTSGVAHYDAADSTPLFLRAVGTYAAWTGDVAALTVWWPDVLRALAFVHSCDRDDDGLPENTGIGHGWIEMGPLGGGAVTSYVAAIWIDALRRLIPVATRLGDADTAQRLGAALERASHAIEALRGPDGVLALHRDAAGRLSPDRTAMATVPLALGVGASSSDHELLRDLASPRFSAPWGLRMLPVDDPRYDPTAYHAGSAWPLFTGWAALADCATGSVDRGFARVQSLAGAAMAGGTGGFAEVLNGNTGGRAGVCPDQAWSAAMILTPIVRGVAGLVPDALNGRCAMRARVPAAVSALRLEGVRVGATRIDLQWGRVDGAGTLTATHRVGPPIELCATGLGASARETTRGSGPPRTTGGGMLPRSDDVRTCSAGHTVSWTVPDEGPR